MDQEDQSRGAGEAFREDAGALLAVLEEAPESILVETPEGSFLYGNRDARATIGVSALNQLVGASRGDIQTVFEMRDETGRLLGTDDLTSVRSLAEPDPQEVVHVRGRQSGAEHWRLVKSRAVRGADGAPRYIVTTWHDLSQRRRAEAGLRLRAEAGRLLASSLDFGTTLQNLAALVLPALADACMVDVIAEDGSIQRPMAGAALPAEDEIMRELRGYPPRRGSSHPTLKTLTEGESQLYGVLPAPVRADLHAAAHDGAHEDLLRRIGFRAVISVPLVARRQILGALVLCMTSSGRSYDEADRQLAEDVGRLAGLSLANARLYDQAQRAVHLRDEFLHVAAHELKTPLTSVRGFAQLALRHLRQRGEGAEPEVLRALERIDSGSQKLGRLVTQLLDISRLEGGRLKLVLVPEDLAALVRRAAADFGGPGGAGNLRVRAPAALPCTCDALRIEQVLLNLLDNAVKYSPEGSPIDLTLSSSDGAARLEVTDHGIGVPPEHRGSIFDRFYQAHAEHHVSGMGLGLFISREIVQLHGGRLFAEFPDEGGARFVIELPLGAAAGPA